MPPFDSASEPNSGKASYFQTTHWSIVLAAAREDSPRRTEALEKLCRVYWYPLYAYVRQRGHSADDAQDLIQEFLARLLEKNWLADLEPLGGRFRSFLLTALNRFLINEYDRNHAAKRGGGKLFLSLDQERAAGRFLNEPASDETPEKNFDRRWALAVLDQALEHLRKETDLSGKAQQFQFLNPFLSREAEPNEYETIASRLGTSPGAVAVAVHRLRQRYREVVREEIANTVAEPGQVDEEMKNLFTALRG